MFTITMIPSFKVIFPYNTSFEVLILVARRKLRIIFYFRER